MKIDLPASTFKSEKKGDVKRLRREGKIPAVLYGHKEKTKQIYVDQKEFKRVLDTLKEETVIVNLKLGSKSYACVIKSLQQNPMSEELMHIDFQHIHKKEKVKAIVPIHPVGEPPGVKKGGIMDVHLHEVVVKCLPDALPSHIDVDVNNLDLGETIHLRDLTADNIEYELSLDTTVISILVPRALEVEVKPTVEEEAVAAEEGVPEEEKKEVKEGEEAKEGKEEKAAKEAPKTEK